MSHVVKLHYSEEGQGLPLVLLHGFPLNSSIWREQQKRLSDQYRVITPDLRGHGQSAAPAGVYEMGALAADVLALLDTLQIQKAAILGHSMGGYVTLAAWRLAPQRFLALGMVASQPASDTDEGRQGRLKLAQRVAAEGSQAAADAMLARLFAPGLAADHPVFERVRQIILATPRAAIIGSLNGMAVRHDSTSMLPTIDIPALILAGNDDQIIPRSRVEEMASALPQATLAIVEKAGHMPMLEQPEATTTAIHRFLRALQAA